MPAELFDRVSNVHCRIVKNSSILGSDVYVEVDKKFNF